MVVRLLHFAATVAAMCDLSQISVLGGVQVLRVSELWREPRAWTRPRPDVAVIEVHDAAALHRPEVAALVQALEVPVVVVGPDSAELHAEVLAAGADTYLGQSVADRLLAPQIESLVRKQAGRPRSRRYLVGDLAVDLDARTASVGSQRLSLSVSEFELLSALARRFGSVCDRAELRNLGTYGHPLSERALENHVWRLRAKLEAAGSYCEIETQVRAGYRLLCPGSGTTPDMRASAPKTPKAPQSGAFGKSLARDRRPSCRCPTCGLPPGSCG